VPLWQPLRQVSVVQALEQEQRLVPERQRPPQVIVRAQARESVRTRLGSAAAVVRPRLQQWVPALARLRVLVRSLVVWLLRPGLMVPVAVPVRLPVLARRPAREPATPVGFRSRRCATLRRARARSSPGSGEYRRSIQPPPVKWRRLLLAPPHGPAQCAPRPAAAQAG
jgi:hypothetical protein